MLPVLYSTSSSEFASNGLGVLVDCLKCEVTEERNGIFEMVFTYPASGQHVDLIVPDAIVKATAHYGDEGQLFRIYEVTKTLDGNYEVYCQHISYQLSYIPCLPFNATDAPTAMSMIQSHMITDDAFAQRFAFSTDKTTVANMSVEVPITTRSLLGGVEGSVLDVYGGEYEFDNFNVKLLAHRGQDRGVVLRYGKNISDISQEVNIENVYTHLLPFYNKDGVYVEVPDTYIACETASQFPFKRIMILDCTSEFDLVDEETGEERAPTPQELLEYAQMYMSNRDFGKIDVSIDVDFENISDIIEYSDYANLEMVRLCDTVSVYFPPLDITATTNVIKTVWNVLLDRYKELSLGKPKSNFQSAVASVTDKATEKVENKTYEVIDKVTRTILGLNGGYKVEKTNGNGQIIETLYMDTLDEATATKVWRWNINGLAFSPNGINGPYTTAITKDGEIVSDFVATGVLQSRDSLTNPNFYLNLDTGSLKGNFSELKIAALPAATQKYATDAASGAVSAFQNGTYAQFVTKTANDLAGLQSQIDGQIETYFDNYIPTLNNLPASQWTDTTTRDKHLGDLFYIVDNPDRNGETYRFAYSQNEYKWILVEDTAVAAAIQQAQNAYALAGNKKRVFTAQPVPPYDVGDLWVNGNDLYYCQTAQASGQYVASHWAVATKYTKTTTYYQNDAPITDVNIGDLWIDTDDGNKLYRWNGTAWVDVQDTAIQDALSDAADAQATADGKIMTYASATAPTDDPQGTLDKGDLWIDTDDNNKLYRWNGTSWVAYTDSSAVVAYDNTLNQLAVFNKLTNNGQTQGIYLQNGLLYINGTYMQIGKISSANGRVYFDLDNDEIVCSLIRSAKPFVSTSGTDPGEVVLNIGYFQENNRWESKAHFYYNGYSDYGIYVVPSKNGGGWIESPLTKGVGITSKRYDSGTLTSATVSAASGTVSLAAEKGTSGGSLRIYASTTQYPEPGIHLDGPSYVESGCTLKAYYKIEAAQLTVSGSKNRVVKTSNYDQRLQYSYETATPYFGDIGEGVLNEEGEIYIDVDPIFAETVRMDLNYQVFLQKYGPGDLWIDERTEHYFIVKGTPGLKFSWELKARQLSFEACRLDEVSELDIAEDTTRSMERVLEQDTYDYGEEAFDIENVYDENLDDILAEQEELLYEAIE